MAGNEIYANTKQLDRLAELLQGYPKDAVKVLNAVLGRAVDTVRVETARQIPRVFGAPQKEIRSALNSGKRKVKAIMGESGEGSISIAVIGRPLTLTRFQHKPVTPKTPGKGKKKRTASAAVKIVNDKGLRPLKPLPGADGKNKPVFLMPAKAGAEDRYLFAARTGAKSGAKEKVKVLRTLSVPQMVTDEKVGTAITEKVNETVEKRLTHELDRLFGNLGTNLAQGAK